ncbi:MAG: adenine phosphoribosyltransferase [Gemmatimonadetes bacterium]|nr:adenine phosphoribosyltransferase [Gemmatimonadota bacterium]
MLPLADRLRATVREVPDFPKPGILFKDITPVLGQAALFREATEAMAAPWRGAGVTHVVAIESRGFLFGAPIAQALGAGLVPVRKPGKLPARTVREDYALEYGTDALEMHADALASGHRVLIVDDVLATGGTAGAASALVRRTGASVAGLSVFIDLLFLGGPTRLPAIKVSSALTYG